MAMNHWLRLWHDMPNDPKWRTIARASGRSISEVMAVYCHLLVMASQNPERGMVPGLEGLELNFLEALATPLDLDIENVEAVLKAMQGRVLSGAKISGWDARQLAREEPTTAREKTTGPNYIYYVAATGSDVVKVGISRNPWSRVSDLQTGSAAKFELLATLKTTARSEKALHKLLAQSRESGEWFRRSTALNSLIERTRSKQITTLEQSLEFLGALPPDAFVVCSVGTVVATATTKERDTDTDIKEHTPRVRETLPVPIEDDCERPKFAMTDAWEPDPESFKAVLFRNAMANQTFHADQLLEFRSYWISRPDSHMTQAQWEHALAQRLKAQHLKNQSRGHSHDSSGRTDPKRTRNAHDILHDPNW